MLFFHFVLALLLPIQSIGADSSPGSSQSMVIEKTSIPDPKVGDTCVYRRVDYGRREHQYSESVVHVTPGYSYRVTVTGPQGVIGWQVYSRDGARWFKQIERFVPRFEYPLHSRKQWDTRYEVPKGSRGKITNYLTTLVEKVEIQELSIGGVNRPIRIVEIGVSGYYEEYNPASDAGDRGMGRIKEKIVYAPDIHCIVHRSFASTRWDNQSPSESMTLDLIEYRPALGR